MTALKIERLNQIVEMDSHTAKAEQAIQANNPGAALEAIQLYDENRYLIDDFARKTLLDQRIDAVKRQLERRYQIFTSKN